MDSLLIKPRHGNKNTLPLELHWSRNGKGTPLPIRRVRGHRANPPPIALAWSPRYASSSRHQLHVKQSTPDHHSGLDFGHAIHSVCQDIVSHSPEFKHLHLPQILITITQSRTAHRHGLQAKVTPLRFRKGQMIEKRRGKLLQVQRYWLDQVELLYLVTFCLPRFLNQPFEEKCITLFHELYHIAPEFNGDLRRHGGRCAIHTSSKKAYDQSMLRLAEDYLNRTPNRHLHSFLKLNFEQLQACHGQVFGHVVPIPKLVPVEI